MNIHNRWRCCVSLWLLLAVTFTANAALIEWVGGTSDDFGDASNWSPSQLPTAADTVLFSSSANNIINWGGTTVGVTGDVFQFETKYWQIQGNIILMVGSGVSVADNNVRIDYGTQRVDIGNRTVTMDIETGRELYVDGFYNSGTAGDIIKTGGGDLNIEKEARFRVNTFTVEGGRILTSDEHVIQDYHLANGSILEVTRNYMNFSADMTGTGAVHFTGARMRIGGGTFSDRVDVVVDGDAGFNSVEILTSGLDWSGAGNTTDVRNISIITLGTGNPLTFTLDGLDGDAGTLVRADDNQTKTLTIGADGGGGRFDGTLADDPDAGTATLALIKSGSGTQILSGTNTYTGATTINGGSLIVNGAHVGGGTYTVAAAGELGGNGGIDADISVSGSINPGSGGIGTLSVTGTVTAAGTWNYDLGGAGSSDLLSIDGDFSDGGLLVFDFGGGGSGGIYTLVEWTGATDINPSLITAQNLGGGLSAVFSFNGSTLEAELIDCSTPPSVTLGADPSVPYGSATADLTYSSPVNSPETFTILFSADALAEGFTNVSETALSSSPITVSLPAFVNPGAYTGTLTVSRSSDGCFSSHEFVISVTLDGDIIEWVGGAGDDLGNAANWNPAQVPTIDDVLIFDTSANNGIVQSASYGVTGDVYQFRSKSWQLQRTTATIGSSLSVEGGNVTFRFNGTRVNIGNRTVTLNVEAERELFIEGFVDTGSPGDIVMTGSGTVQVDTAYSDEIDSFTVNGGVLKLNNDNAADTYVLGGGTVWFYGFMSDVRPTVSGSGTVLFRGNDNNQVKNVDGGSFSHAGNIVVRGTDNPAMRVDASVVDWSGHSGTFRMETGATLHISAFPDQAFTVNALYGEKNTQIRADNNGTKTFTVGSGGGSAVFAGTLADDPDAGTAVLALTKTGSGTQTLTGTNTYSGATTVSQGTLLINGANAGGGDYIVASGATLGGVGTIAGDLTVNGSVAPGISGDATLTVTGSVTAAGIWLFDLASPGNSDLLRITGDFLKGGGLVFDFGGDGVEGSYTIVDWSGTTDFLATDFTGINLAGNLQAVFTVNGTQLDIELIDCATTPSLTLGADPTVTQGATTADLPYSSPVNSPNQYQVAYADDARAEGFADVAVTALPSSPITLAVPGAAAAGTYTGSLIVSRSGDGCYSEHEFSVTIEESNISIVEWIGGTSDDLNNTANWSPARLPAANDIVLFDSSANSLIIPGYNPVITGNVFQFQSRSWELQGGYLNIMSGVSVTGGTVRLDFGTGPRFDIGNRSVTVDVASAASLYVERFVDTGVSGQIVKTGAGRFTVEREFINPVNTWYVNGGELYFANDAASQPVVLANDAVVFFGADYKNFTASVSGLGTAVITNGRKNVRGGTMTQDGDIIVDADQGSTPSLNIDVSSINWSGITGNFRLLDTSDVYIGSGNAISFTITGLDGDAGTLIRADNNNAKTLSLGNGGNSGSYPGTLADGGSATLSLVKNGSGTQTLSGNNTYSGTTVINAGTLEVNGTHTGGGTYTVASGARVAGTGSIGAAMSVNGSVAPGDGGIGTLSVNGNVTWNSGASATAGTDWYFDLGAAPSCDTLDITGDFIKGGGSVFRFNFGGSTEVGTYVLVDWSGSSGFTANDFSFVNLGPNLAATFAVNGSQLEVTVATCSENPTITLGSGPDVCLGTTSADLPYTDTTLDPTHYAIDYDDYANSVGLFTDVSSTALPASPIPVSISAFAPAGIYTGTLRVIEAGGCFSDTEFTVTVRGTPDTPGTITQGNPSGNSVCAGDTGVTYTIAEVPLATTYVWTVPAGASITAGQGTTQITVNWGLAGSGNVSVYAGNACGNGSARNKAVTVRAGAPSVPTAAAPGEISTTSFVANWGSVASIDGYYLDVATTENFSGGFVLQDESVAGTSRTLTGLSGGQTYYYRVRAYNACGASAYSDTITVILPKLFVGWDVSGLAGGAGDYGNSPLTPSASAADILTAGGLTRGAGVAQAGTAAARGWGGTGWDSVNDSAAATAGDVATFTLAPNEGNHLSFFAVSVIDYRRDAAGPTTGKLQYSLDGSSFIELATLDYPSADSAGGSVGSVNLSNIPALQDVPPGETVTFRIVNYGASDAGGAWYIYDTGASSSYDLEVIGTVCTNPSIYNVTGGGAYCSGDAGAVVGLSDSDPYVTYELYRDGSPLGVTVAGSGNAISFGAQSVAGTYTVVATRNAGGCEQVMNGSVAVSVTATPSAPTITGSTVNNSPTSVDIDWTGPGGTVTGYVIKRSTGSGGPYTDLATVDDLVLTYNDDTAVIGNTYYYVVSALNGSCESSDSVEEEVQMPAGCPDGYAPTLTQAGSITVIEGSSLQHVITAADSSADCPSPSMVNSELPGFISSSDGTGPGSRTRTFTISPDSGDEGTYPVRVTATDSQGLTTSIVFNVYIGTAGEPNGGTSSPPPSQTNWYVSIDSLTVPPSGDATVTWLSTNGMAYDVYVSLSPPGSGGSWSREVVSEEASGNTAQANVVQSSGSRYYQVVPAGMSPAGRGVWGVVKRSVPTSISYMSPPLDGSDRDFGGDFGAEMAASLTQAGTKIYIMNPGTGGPDENGDAIDWIILERGQNGWERFGGGALPVLTNGQGFMVFNLGGAASPTFSGPVGNTGAKSIQIAGGTAANPGYNIIGISEGRALPASTAFDGIPVVGSYDANAADQVVIMQPDGSFRRLIRRPDGTWYDTGRPNNPNETDLLLMPGEAYYYIRRGGNATLDF